MSYRCLTAAAAALMILAASPAAWGDAPPPSATQLLASFDTYMQQVHSEHMVFDLTVGDDAVFSRTARLDFLARDGQYRLGFSQPANMRWYVVLSLDLFRNYMTQPFEHKFRRIASRPRTPLLGSTFTFEDLVIFPLSPYFDAAYLQAPEGKVLLSTTAKKGLPLPYGRIDYVIDSETQFVEEVRFYDDQNTLIRTEVRSEPRCDQGVCMPSVRKMTDHRRNMTSELRISDMQLNGDVAKTVFSLNHLKRTY